jgi:nitrite reductase (NO-forming)
MFKNKKCLLAAGAAVFVLSMPVAGATYQDHSAHAAGTATVVTDVVRAADDLPPALARRNPETVRVHLDTTEVTGQLDDGTTYHYWTFNGKVPGPFVRVRVGDTVEVTLKNAADSAMMHNVDFHAVTGPGGGAVAQHIANGMYGLILVEPAEGLPKVDREFYVMQGEIYTEQPFGTKGEATESVDKLLAETPEYYVFNGAADALARHPLQAKTGETVRIFFGVGGPNKTSSFHVIGEIFDRAYPLASITSAPMTDVQTITVPPGGAAMTEFKVDVPGKFVLVDHALSRMERGLKGLLVVDGEAKPDIYKPHQASDPNARTGHE